MAGKVRVLPIGIEIEVGDGESLLVAARRQGYRWPTVCGGHCECGACFLIVDAGAEHLSPISDDERSTLRHSGKAGDPRARLACQVTVDGPATVTRRGVRPNGP